MPRREVTAMTSPRLGRRVARFNRSVTNRVVLPLAGRVPHLGIVVHQGRRSGVEYRTPVNVFRVPDGFGIALTYGRQSDWVRNAVAAGGVRLITEGREYQVTDPHFVDVQNASSVPTFVKSFLHVLRVSDFLELRVVE
jgi:deazaflavin-dependent oxidoreductase (nitroreductase family)